VVTVNATQLEDVRIETRVESYQLTSSGNGCTGIIAWKAGGEYFPDERWNDFILVLARWWLSSLNELLGSGGSTVFQFMDGPFYIECVRTGTEVQGKFIDDRRNRRIVSDWKLSVSGLTEQVTEFSKSILAYCDQNNISGSDVEELRRATEVV
jgi:hypothetical protein